MITRAKAKTGKKTKVVNIAVSDILPNPNQPRTYFDDDLLNSLADNIRRFGIIQPLTVKRRENVPRMNINGQIVAGPFYEIVAGERRWRAAKKIGLPCVPCLISECDSVDTSFLAFSENVFREDLSFFDIASSLQDMLVSSRMTQAELAKTLSVSQSAIANKLRLLRLDYHDRDDILRAGLTEKHARAFIRIEDEEKRREFIRKAILLRWSAQDTDKKISDWLSSSTDKTSTKLRFRGKRIGAISDIGVFINSIDSAVKMVRDVGVRVEREEIDRGDSIEIVIKIPKNASSAQALKKA